ncbi:M20 family metallopeptidase [Paenibacillus hunanensis]|uniref:M20 family metallopeptidase n=1 Tax=Paenibacillus hunanensis TaxID=539262 RepID=UPI002A6AF045|nr:M20 family metallopeptidase [Paenibacillus hunanensis]WPP41657.1 M20 family metallopeptidase [Paenibacillus hunanensis]
MDAETIRTSIASRRERLIAISDQIWEYAETRFQEQRSAELICLALEEAGFHVERGAGGIDTAFIGSYGSGHPVIAVLGEYDALSGLSQMAGQATYAPLVEGGNGHGCGHNLLGTASLGAVLALKEQMEQHGLEGTIRYYGCPAEEGGSGKTFMVRAGLFDDVDGAVTWHPFDYHSVMSVHTLANYQYYYRFKGRSAHAAAAPHLGRSALDAAELMNVGVNYLREHIVQEARIHYALTDSGGHSPNVVQSQAEVLYLIRAPHIRQAADIAERVHNVARGAALMTGTEVEIIFDKACSEIVPNRTLEQVVDEQFRRFSLPEHTADELALAEAIRESLTDEEKQASWQLPPSQRELALANEILPYEHGKWLSGSTDVADVSWVTPTVQCTTACFVNSTAAHSWQWVAVGKTSIAHKGMLYAAEIMAATALEMLTRPELLAAARQELEERLHGQEYVCPIPAEVQPNIPVK